MCAAVLQYSNSVQFGRRVTERWPPTFYINLHFAKDIVRDSSRPLGLVGLFYLFDRECTSTDSVFLYRVSLIVPETAGKPAVHWEPDNWSRTRR